MGRDDVDIVGGFVSQGSFAREKAIEAEITITLSSASKEQDIYTTTY